MELAEFLQALDTEAGGGKSKIVPETLPFPDPIEEADPVTLAERVGIRFEAETPENLGNPVFQYRGHILAWENDAPETKVYAWGLVNLFPGRPLAVDINSMASLLQLSPPRSQGGPIPTDEGRGSCPDLGERAGTVQT